MSVQTKADDSRDYAKKLIKEAYEALQVAIDEGDIEYSKSYLETLEDALYGLRKIARKL